MNTMTINGYQAVISFDPDIQMFRGAFVGLNGGAISMLGIWRGCSVKVRFHYAYFLKRVSVAVSNHASAFQANFRYGLILPRMRPLPLPLLRMGRV